MQYGEGEGQGDDPRGAGLTGVAQQEAGQGAAEQQEERRVHDGAQPPAFRVVRSRHAERLPSTVSLTVSPTTLNWANTPIVTARGGGRVSRSDDPPVARSAAHEQP
ncbi:hypothetical protein GCM10010377_28980 [Streptomyces viridiviolaceus]|nr:hypothetical protein GCM10010377_28980 [Streptomyces viridiviolaceus]